MATQCWLNNTLATLLHHQQHQNNHHPHHNHHHNSDNNNQQQQQQQQQQQTFVSSSAYYGYVPAVASGNATIMPPTARPLDSRNNVAMDMDVEEESRQKRFFDNTEDERCVMRVRKRCLVQDDVADYIHNFKRFREEAVVTNVFSMVQENNGCHHLHHQQEQQSPNNMDWPRCAMSRYYV